MGGLSVYMPFTSSSCVMVSNFAPCGMPALTGFYCRDFILEIYLCLDFSCLCLLACWFVIPVIPNITL